MAAGAEELADAVAEQREIPVSDPFIAPAEQVAQAPVEAPQVVMDRERLQREAETLNARYEQRRATEAPVPSPAPETRAEEPKRGFSLFGRRRKPVESAPKTAPVAATAPSVQAPRAPSGDLFGDSLDEGDLEIPAFLRRQAN